MGTINSFSGKILTVKSPLGNFPFSKAVGHAPWVWKKIPAWRRR